MKIFMLLFSDSKGVEVKIPESAVVVEEINSAYDLVKEQDKIAMVVFEDIEAIDPPSQLELVNEECAAWCRKFNEMCAGCLVKQVGQRVPCLKGEA